MEIHLRPATPAELCNSDDFSAFKVVAHGFGSAAELRSALSALGQPDDDSHVFVRVEWLQANEGKAADPRDWRRRLDGMLDLAARHGWTDEAGRVRAHVENREA